MCKMYDKVKIIQGTGLDPYHNLAVESALMDGVSDGELIVYLWRNDNTVVIGRHQNAYLDVNVGRLYEDGGKLARRPTGGGAVYHDANNLNFSFITGINSYDKASNNSIILDAVRLLGLDAEISGRNDIEIDGRKFSGAAYLKTNTAALHHGTVLIAVDTAKMTKYLNVKADKLSGKGVSSVRARVVNLSEIIDSITVDKVTDALIGVVYANYPFATVLGADEIDKKAVEQYKKKYSDNNYLFGRDVALSSNKYRRFGWGYADVHFTVDAGVIKDIIVYSDALDTGTIEGAENSLRGVSVLNAPAFDNEIAADLYGLINEK